MKPIRIPATSSPGNISQGDRPAAAAYAHEGDAEIGAERVERAAGEIDDLLHAEHELQAGGDQKQDGGVKHAADQDIGERHHLERVPVK